MKSRHLYIQIRICEKYLKVPTLSLFFTSLLYVVTCTIILFYVFKLANSAFKKSINLIHLILNFDLSIQFIYKREKKEKLLI